MVTHSGECLCGKIRYEITGKLRDALACHCSICRKAFSGAGSVVSWIDSGRFAWIAGEKLLKVYTNRSGFGLGFCRECGTTLCGILDARVVFVTLGTLNGAPDVKIGRHIFVGSKAPWDEIGGNAPQYRERPDTDE